MENEHDEQEFDDWPWVPRMMELPEIFHSLEHDGPFEKCLICEYPLFGASTDYTIERIFRGTEPILEYAICGLCQQEAHQHMSAASAQQIEQLFSTVDHQARIERLREHLDDGNADAWIDHCLLTGRPRAECRGYQIIARCSSLEIGIGLLPIMISDEAAKQIAGLMSQETRGFMDDFMDRFGLPPEFSADPEWMPIFH